MVGLWHFYRSEHRFVYESEKKFAVNVLATSKTILWIKYNVFSLHRSISVIFLTKKKKTMCGLIPFLSCVCLFFPFALARIQMCHLVDFIGELKLFVFVWMKRLNVYFTIVKIIWCSLLMMMFDIKFYVSKHFVFLFSMLVIRNPEANNKTGCASVYM